MEICKDTIKEIFNRNFSFQIIESKIGTVIEMDAINAFIFANITGAGYLNNCVYPFSPKGFLKILREAFKYNLVTGIYDRGDLHYSPNNFLKTMPKLFVGNKYILLVEGKDERDFSQHLKESYNTLISNNIDPSDYIIFRIETWKKGNGMESFLEYLTCEYFKNKGFIVENQIPLTHSSGSPDFGGFHISNTSVGFHIIELSMLKITKNVGILDLLRGNSIDYTIVGEAKTATTSMKHQIKKYMDTGLFAMGFEIHPSKAMPSVTSLGMINIAEDYSINCMIPNHTYNTVPYNYHNYMQWYQNNLKLFMLANFSAPELDNFLNTRCPNGYSSQEKLISTVQNTPLIEMIDVVKGVI